MLHLLLYGQQTNLMIFAQLYHRKERNMEFVLHNYTIMIILSLNDSLYMVETSLYLDYFQGLSKSAMPNELYLIKNVILDKSISINEIYCGCTISIKIIYIFVSYTYCNCVCRYDLVTLSTSQSRSHVFVCRQEVMFCPQFMLCAGVCVFICDHRTLGNQRVSAMI